MEIQTRNIGDVTVISVNGNLDAGSDPLFKSIVRLGVEGRVKIVCNLAEVKDVDYYGLAVFPLVLKTIHQHGGTIKLAQPPDKFVKILKFMRLNKMFDMYEHEADAMQAFESDEWRGKIPDNRFTPRVDLEYPVRFYVGSSGNAEKHDGVAHNLSTAGVFIKTDYLIPRGTIIRVTMELKDKKRYAFKGKVVWHADRELQPECYPGMGVLFINTHPEVQTALLDFIMKRINEIFKSL
ncbi:MAG: STAS domain-containing protein [Candidatus Omnitrophota bacterium]